MIGPSVRAVCRILNQSSCGSGSICGIRDGKALILTNAHVAGTSIGRIVQVDVESTGDRIQARVIMAAYSNKTSTDWAILETLEPYTKVEPVKLSKKRPVGSHYTKGFPRCQPFAGSDIQTVELTPQVWFWEPDAIGGQSGSGVWSDDDNLCYGLLTWQWNNHGAGQPSAAIYIQAKNQTVAGAPRRDGLVELPDFDFQGVDRSGVEDDPVVTEGFVQEADITTLPIWAEDDPVPPVDPTDPSAKELRNLLIEYHREAAELHNTWRARFEGVVEDGASGSGGPIFGL